MPFLSASTCTQCMQAGVQLPSVLSTVIPGCLSAASGCICTLGEGSMPHGMLHRGRQEVDALLGGLRGGGRRRQRRQVGVYPLQVLVQCRLMSGMPESQGDNCSSASRPHVCKMQTFWCCRPVCRALPRHDRHPCSCLAVNKRPLSRMHTEVPTTSEGLKTHSSCMLHANLVQHCRTRGVLGLDLVSAQFIPAVLLEELPRALVAAQHRKLRHSSAAQYIISLCHNCTNCTAFAAALTRS